MGLFNRLFAKIISRAVGSSLGAPIAAGVEERVLGKTTTGRSGAPGYKVTHWPEGMDLPTGMPVQDLEAAIEEEKKNSRTTGTG